MSWHLPPLFEPRDMIWYGTVSYGTWLFFFTRIFGPRTLCLAFCLDRDDNEMCHWNKTLFKTNRKLYFLGALQQSRSFFLYFLFELNKWTPLFSRLNKVPTCHCDKKKTYIRLMTAVFRYQNSVFSIDQRGPLRQYLDHTLRKEHF